MHDWPFLLLFTMAIIRKEIFMIGHFCCYSQLVIFASTVSLDNFSVLQLFGDNLQHHAAPMIVLTVVWL